MILAFDTATSFGAVCGVSSGARERAERAGDLLAAVDRLVDDPASIEGIVVGRGPGSFTSIRIGMAVARALSLALDVQVAGASTLDAFRGGMPVIDARRGEVFAPGPRVCRPEELDVAGKTLVGDGAVRYRDVFEAAGADVPADDDPVHLPDPLLLLERAGPFGDAALVEPLVRARAGREAAGVTAVAVRIRPLELGDLTSIEEIEQRAYPTPWSRSMFASELAKPTSICLGAFEGDELVGYVVNSRYVDAWHIMNVAVVPERQRRGIATALLERLFELTRHDERRGFTLEVRVSNDGAIRLYEELGFEARGVRRGYYTDNREDALIMWRDGSIRRVILGIETSCDETAAAVVTWDGEIVSQRGRVAGRAPCAVRWSRARGRVSSPPRADCAGDRARRSTGTRWRRSPSRTGPV